jgi:hypothetical protein
MNSFRAASSRRMLTQRKSASPRTCISPCIPPTSSRRSARW